MRVDVTTDIVIDRAPSLVSSFAAEPNNAPAWYVNIKSVEWQTPPRLAVGSRIAFVAHFLGRRIAYVYEIVEFHSGERLVMRTADGPFPMETTYAWHQAPDGGTRMTLRNRGTPRGFSVWIAPFVTHAMRRANRKDLGRLKRLLESRVDGVHDRVAQAVALDGGARRAR
ncbi:MAG: SRPBCC family protein [Vicinamibacterales bacterium]